MQVGTWVAAIALAVLVGLAGFSVWRFKRFAPEEAMLPVRPQFSLFGNLHTPLIRIFWAVYRLIASLFSLSANLLEGDGGLLWTLLLLVLFITIFRGR
jgi:hypothetical protein